VAAVLVLFDPTANPEATLSQLSTLVGTVVLVDNAEFVHPWCAAQEALPHNVLQYRNANAGGLAGAYNAALSFLRLNGISFSQVVFLDEDSDVSVLAAFMRDQEVMRVLASPSTAAVAPAFRERETGMRGRGILLERWHVHFLARDAQGLQTVTLLINSMSVWRADALKRIGDFNEGLAIDLVDTEYCLRARHAELKVYMHGSHEFLHTIGHRRIYKFLGRTLQSGGHSPARRYLIGRNTAWLGRTYVFKEPAWSLFFCVGRLAHEFIGIALAEDERGKKLSQLTRGVLAGIFMRRLRLQAP